jgi:hypothetical protein
MSRVVVHIDGLLLRGFHAADSLEMVAGLQLELTRSCTREIALILAQRNDLSLVRARGIRVGPLTRPAQVGQAVARSITRGLRK